MKSSGRKSRLDDAHKLHEFQADSRELLIWANDMKAGLTSDELGKDSTDADELIDKHQEKKKEIDNKEDRFEALLALGKQMLSASRNAPEVRETMKQLTQERQGLRAAWAARNDQLQDCLQLQWFNREAEQVEGVIASQEAMMANEDIGSALDSAESLVKKHEGFEVQLAAQDERIAALGDQAYKLINAGHYDAASVASRRDAVLSRSKKVKDMATARKLKLQDSVTYHKFKRDAADIEAWMNEKLQVASDESFKDPTNLPAKLQKHQAFEAELAKNKASVDAVLINGETLCQTKHYASPEIKQMVVDLNRLWRQLTDASTDKAQKLVEACDQQNFNRGVEDFDMWLKDVEAVLRSGDLGKDLSTVNHLLKKQQLVENDIQMHADIMSELRTQGNSLVARGHYNSEAIQRKTRDLDDRFQGLSTLVAERRSQLDASHKVHQFFRDVEDENQWIREHIIVAASPDVGSSLTSVQNLQKKHQALELELATHRSRVSALDTQTKELMAQGHFASDAIFQQNRVVQSSWKNLLAHAEKRKTRLADSLNSQQYYFEANEADVWMNEKAGIASNQDYGKDEDSAENLLQSHKTLELDVESYATVVNKLAEEAHGLSTGGHFDAANITMRQAQVEEQLLGLQTLTASRKHRLQESKKLHQFNREVDVVMSWLNDKQAVASSEDYGKDFEHLEVLQKKFEDFRREVLSTSENYKATNTMARKLVAEGHSDTVMIKDKQDQMRAGFNLLQDQIATRSKKLAGAHEIHKYKRDAGELLGRIQEKDTALPEDHDLGRNLGDVKNLISKHEVFEREIAALGTQVQSLDTEASRLAASYPGAQARDINSKQEEVAMVWEDLQARSMLRRNRLKASLELQTFNSSVRDTLSWIGDMKVSMTAEVSVHSVTEADDLMSRHNSDKAEVDAREDGINKIRRTAERLISQGHYAASEIRERLSELSKAKASLDDAWLQQRRHFGELIGQQQFFRDSRQVDDMSNAQELFLLNDDLADTVDGVEAMVKKHEAFEKTVAAQEEKVTALVDFFERLEKENHFDKENMEAHLLPVLERRQACKEKANKRKERLNENRNLVNFRRDIGEVMSWIWEKMQTATDESYLDPTNLTTKLQQHQAFESELSANEDRVEAVTQAGDSLIAQKHYAAQEVQKQLNDLFTQWEKLKVETDNRGRGLAEAMALVQFNREADMVELWIKEKSQIASQEETGRDLEHCEMLQRKFDDFMQDLVADGERLESVRALAERLIEEGHSDGDAIDNRLTTLMERWDELLALSDGRKDTLENAKQVHKFNRDANDVNDRIHSKRLVLSVDDYGKDLPGVEGLLRKHDELERDLTVIEGRLEELDKEAERLVHEQPPNASEVKDKLEDILSNWEALIEQANARKSKLEDSRKLQEFLKTLRNLQTWMADITVRMTSGELAQDVDEAETMLEAHQERQAEIAARTESTASLKAFGEELTSNGHYASDEIRSKLLLLDKDREKLLSTWQTRADLLNQCLDLQRFNREVEQVDAWIGTQEAFLQNDDVGDTLDGVDALNKKHDDFEKSIEAQEEKIRALDHYADKLINEDHYDKSSISSRRDGVLLRRTKLIEASGQRKLRLEDSYKFQQFRRDAFEVESWINEKVQIASDESYQDASNLQGKLQQHNAFEAELTANKSRVDSVVLAGETLIEAGHFASTEIESRLDDVQAFWQKLSDASTDKSQKLTEARQQKLFARNVEDIEAWIQEVETALSSEDFGRDLTSVKQLQKKHQILEAEITAHQDRIDDITSQVKQFRDSSHFRMDEIEDLARSLFDRYYALTEPMSRRHQSLDDALELQQFYKDVDDELTWIREKEPLAAASDLGQNLTGVQNLLKKHQVLEGDVVGHQALVDRVASTGQSLIVSGHSAAVEIKARGDMLQLSWSNLQTLVSNRRAQLEDSLEVHRFYSEATEAESWMRDRRPLIASEDYGRDEDSTEASRKKHEAIVHDLEGFSSTIQSLRSESERLINRGHFDSFNIQERQSKVEEKYEELLQLGKVRAHRLSDSQKLHQFNREVEEVEAWIEEKEAVAASEDYGNDLEHCEMLQKKFNDFTHDLLAGEDRVVAVDDLAQKLIDDGHIDAEFISNRREEVRQLWADVNEQTTCRIDALANAKEIHAFNRDVDDTKGRVVGKEAALSDDYGKDLATVQALQRRHEGFEVHYTVILLHFLSVNPSVCLSVYPVGLSSPRLACASLCASTVYCLCLVLVERPRCS
jgi:spectrin beta